MIAKLYAVCHSASMDINLFSDLMSPMIVEGTTVKNEDETSESDRRFTDAAAAAELNANCKILFDDGKEAPIYVNRELLAVYSVFFRAVFHGDFSEKNAEEIQLTGVQRADFLLFLSCLYAPAKNVDLKNLMTIWKVADYFDSTILMDECERVVETARQPSSVEEFKNLIEFWDLRKDYDKVERILEGADFKTISALLDKEWMDSLDEKTRKMVFDGVQCALRPTATSTRKPNQNEGEVMRSKARVAAGQSPSRSINRKKSTPKKNSNEKERHDSWSSDSSSSTSSTSSSSTSSTSSTSSESSDSSKE